MDKTTKGFADELALKHVGGIVHDEVDRLCEISYRDGYLKAIEGCNVKQLQEENERLRAALVKIESLADENGEHSIWLIVFNTLYKNS